MKAIKISIHNAVSLFIILLFLCSNISYANLIADSTSAKKKGVNHEMHNHMNMSMDNKTKDADTSDIIRKGSIDLKKIDANKDGKVYQDQMDWNVISDKPGKCPICKMTLKEVTLKEAKENLKKHEFKVK